MKPRKLYIYTLIHIKIKYVVLCIYVYENETTEIVYIHINTYKKHWLFLLARNGLVFKYIIILF
jgi:hypothetical protein